MAVSYTHLIDAGFEIKHIAQNAKAMRYRDSLKQTQDQLQATIERQALHGQRLDVVWNLTLAANMISANVPRSAIEKIAALDGVKAVVEETCYQPQVVSVGGEYRPDMAVSGQMTGACPVSYTHLTTWMSTPRATKRQEREG